MRHWTSGTRTATTTGIPGVLPYRPVSRDTGTTGGGRDHWTACQSIVLAGGGIRGGQTFGKTDEHAEYPVEKVMGPENIAHTVYHAMGIDDLTATDVTGRPFNILEKGRPLTELF